VGFGLIVLTWTVVLQHIVGKMIDLPEQERMEYMLHIAGQASRREVLERKFKDEALQRVVALAHADIRKEATSESMSLATQSL
jgi:hypothetical protein